MTELLDLSTIVERDTVNIKSKRHPKGKLYELVSMDELGPFEHAVIVRYHTEASTLLQSQATKKLTPPQERKLRKMLGDIVKLLMPSIDDVVLKELSDAHLARIVSTWAFRNAPQAGDETATPRRRPRTGGESSRGSNGSTGATRKRGGTRQRGS